LCEFKTENFITFIALNGFQPQKLSNRYSTEIMEIKKNPNVNLEKFKFGFFLIGLLVAVGLTLVAFNWASAEEEDEQMFVSEMSVIEDEMIEITRSDIEPPKPNTEQEQLQAEVIDIVEDNTEIPEELEFDTEADEDTEISADLLESEDEDDEAEAPHVFVVVDKMPEFPGGQTALRQYIATKIVYPQAAYLNKIEGTVYLTFVVTSKGKVDDITITRGVHQLLDDEAIRVVKTLPDFLPGQDGGKNVSVLYSLPIMFKLN